MKKKELSKIIVPTFYDGSVEPKNPTEGSVWYNGYNATVKVFLGTKWFDMINCKETGYTESEEAEMKTEQDKKRKEAEEELNEYKNKLKNLKKLLNDLFDFE